jgi:hypothetical protein
MCRVINLEVTLIMVTVRLSRIYGTREEGLKLMEFVSPKFAGMGQSMISTCLGSVWHLTITV